MTTHIYTAPLGRSDFVPSGPQFGVKYVLTGPNGQRAAFNDPSDTDYVGWLDNITGLDSPEVREAAEDLIQEDGGIHGAFFYGRRPVILEGQIDNTPGPLDHRVAWAPVAWNLSYNPAFSLNVNDTVNDPSSAGLAASTLTRDTSWASSGAARSVIRVNDASTVTPVVIHARAPSGASNSVNKLPIPPEAAGSPFSTRISLRVNEASTLPAGSFLRVEVGFYDATATAIDVVLGDVANGGRVDDPGAPSTRQFNITGTVPPAAVDVRYSVVASLNPAGVERVIDVSFSILSFYVGPVVVGGEAWTGNAADAWPTRTAWLGAAHNSQSYMEMGTQVPYSAGEVRNIRMTKLARASNAMRADARLLWTPEGGVPQQISVRRQQPLRHEGAFNKRFMAALVAADPRIYSDAVKTQNISPGTTGATVKNVGTADTPPTVTVFGPITNPTVTNVTTGESVVLAYTVAAGTNVVFDMRTKTVTLNGVTDLYDKVDFAASTWWKLRDGDNRVRVTGSGTSGATSLLVSWQDAWV